MSACATQPVLTGQWRAVLTSPGGELPFGLRITKDGDRFDAVAINGKEHAPFSSVEVDGAQVSLRIAGYDSDIIATLSADRMIGRWRKTIPKGDSTLPFVATRSNAPRFAADGPAGADISGAWAVTFSDESGDEVAEGRFEQVGTHLTGTFLTPTGDYRYLDGVNVGGQIALSTFDGAHAFLFRAVVGNDGTLSGDFWSRDTYHATWVAKRKTEAILPDPYAEVTVEGDTLDFSFDDVEGKAVALSDPRFAGKVVIVDVFGTWCPNCNDQAPVLVRWHRAYADRGLSIIGLAYEFTGDVERDRRLVRLFGQRHGIDYPLLLAGTSDKKLAAKTLSKLSAIKSYPTTILIGRDGKVRRVHSGFAGPATGDKHDELVRTMQDEIERLLDEPAP